VRSERGFRRLGFWGLNQRLRNERRRKKNEKNRLFDSNLLIFFPWLRLAPPARFSAQ